MRDHLISSNSNSPVVGRKKCIRFDMFSRQYDPSLECELSNNDWEFHFIPILTDKSFGFPLTNVVGRTVTFQSVFIYKEDTIIFTFFEEVFSNVLRAIYICTDMRNRFCFDRNMFLKEYFGVIVDDEITLTNEFDIIAAFQICRELKITNGTKVFRELGA